MDSKTSEISAAQKASWDKFSPGWKKWDKRTMGFLAAHGVAIIEHLAPQGTQVVLDIAGGTGEPGLSIAAKLSGGKVVLTDLSDGMLEVAIEKAAAAGTKNVEFKQADVTALPFEDNSFDAVSCRLGYMFFPDMLQATREISRVLKPGGKIATTVWGAPDKNYWVTCMVQNIAKHIEMPAPPPGAPGMFRCAKPGLISDLFKEVGLEGVSEREIPSTVEMSGPTEYWDMMTEVAAPFVAALGGADADTVNKVKADVIAAMTERHPDGKIPASGIAIMGTK